MLALIPELAERLHALAQQVAHRVVPVLNWQSFARFGRHLELPALDVPNEIALRNRALLGAFGIFRKSETLKDNDPATKPLP
ncbi:MAG: hypothetical protein RI895_290 [Actinomycetota bacterium]